MRKWQEFGYPDLNGVPFQTALHGLVSALRERAVAEYVSNLADRNVLNIFEKVNIWPIFKAVREFEQIFNQMTNFVLPDGTAFSLKNAAAYLHEDLVVFPVPPKITHWFYPPDTAFEWLSQRYRFLNLAYKVSTGYFRSNSIMERWDGGGESFSEACSNLKLESNNGGEYTSLYGAVVSDVSGQYWSVKKIICVPRHIRYPFVVPGVMCLEVDPQMSRVYSDIYSWEREAKEFTVYPYENQCLKWQWDNLGLDLTFNSKQLFFTRKVSDEQEFRSTIELPELSEPFLNVLRKVQIPLPPGGYENCRLIRGFEAPFRWFCDFRESLKFYDPIENVPAV
jgi:hypothetical protein